MRYEDPVAVYHLVLPIVAAHHQRSSLNGPYCKCDEWKRGDDSGLTHDEHVSQRLAYAITAAGATP